MTNGKLGKESVQDIFELSATQKGMLYHYLEDVHSNLYNVQLSFKIAGDLDIARLKEAIERTQLHNDVLRSVFRWQEANRPLAITRLGHIVGNHSYSHHNMPKFFSSGGDIVSEILKVEDLIATASHKNIRYFRAPYGLWHESLTNCLNRSKGRKPDYKGPIHWDINCSDFDFWARAADANECAEAYLTEIGKIGRGIVLMHDSTADNDIIKRNNLTFETIRILVPELKRLGYSFIGLESIL